MFYLQVIQDEKVIARRQCTTAIQCVETMAKALEYFKGKTQPAVVRMFDGRGMLIMECNWQTRDETSTDET